MPTISEYAKVEAGVVTSAIVADSEHIASRSDGPWVLTPYDGSIGKVGIGYKSSGSMFLAPLQESASVAPASALSVKVAAMSPGSLTYQWQKNGSELSGETSSTLEIASASSGDSGSYTCMVGDGTNIIESSACVVTVA